MIFAYGYELKFVIKKNELIKNNSIIYIYLILNFNF